MNKTVLSIFLCCCIFSAQLHAQVAEDDDFWLLLDYQPPPQNAIWLYAGADEFDGNYYGVTADLAIVDVLHFNLSATQQNYFVETTDLSWGFSGVINPSFSWGLLKTFWGKRDQLEKNDTRLMMSYFNGGFNTQLSYEKGDVVLFFTEQNFILLDSVSTDHRAAQLSLGYRWPEFYGQLSHKQHNYSRDLFILLRRPVSQLLFNSFGIQQATALAETESGILLGFQQTDVYYEIYISRIKSAVSGETNTYATLRLLKALNNQLQLGVDIEAPVNDVPFSAGLSLGILW